MRILPASSIPVVPWIRIGSQEIPLQIIRNPRARRYILRLHPNGCARITLPRGGSPAQALEFARAHSAWLAQQWERQRQLPSSRPWLPGTQILYQGEWTPLQLVEDGSRKIIGLAHHRIRIVGDRADYRPILEAYLRKQAGPMLISRTWELERHCQNKGLPIHRPLSHISVRSQRSRWGSCSIRGTVSLNWRIIQMPAFVRDYLILHELVHLREMNHSQRFWSKVAAVATDYPLAEAWIKAHADHLR